MEVVIIWDLTRRFRDHRGAEGIRGTLTLKGKSWPIICRGDSYKRIRSSRSDRADGKFYCIFAPWTSRAGRKRPAIRVLGGYSKGRIYQHVGNWPYQVQGCWCPGLRETTRGVSSSAKAEAEIFEALGGYAEGEFACLISVLEIS